MSEQMPTQHSHHDSGYAPEDALKRAGAIYTDGATVMTRAAYAESIGYSADSKPLSVTARFSQGTWWRRVNGSWVRIAEMDPGHRYNTAAMLMRGAPHHAFRYAWGFAGEVTAHDGGEMAHDALERALDQLTSQAIRDPREWLKGTALYKALTAGLVIQGDGSEPWNQTGRDPVTGEPCEVPPRLAKVCEIPGCGCSGEAHA